MATLATMQPTSKFGELFQYSNLLAGAGGLRRRPRRCIPKLELGAAYDEAMRTRVFEPARHEVDDVRLRAGARGNHAVAHAPDIDGKPALAVDGRQLRGHPAAPGGRARGAACATCSKYVQMELAEGTLPDGKRTSRKERAARAPHAAGARSARTRRTAWASMVDTKYGVPVVHHGGDMIGFHSDMIWLPEHERRRRDPHERAIRAGSCERCSAASCSRCSSTASPRPTPTSRRRRRRSSSSWPPSASC